MRQLRCGISAKVTNTSGILIDLTSQLCGTDPILLPGQVAEVPVLAEQAIKGAGLIKDSKIFIAIFSFLAIGKIRISNPCSCRTNPTSYTVSRQRIIIPTDIS